MSFDWALLPVSDEEPCGPNLDLSDDPDFIDYYYDALGRIPERLVTPGMETEGGRRTPDQLFDPKTIKPQDEAARLQPLLEKSRDVRLLTLWAQFEALAGRPEPLAEVIETIADLIETFGDALHPAIEGDASDRRDALSELAQPISMVTALRYMGLVGSTDVTLRKLQVTDKKFTANTFEADLKGDALRDALGSTTFRQKVDATHAALLRMSEALGRIQRASKLSPSVPFNPGLDPVITVVAEMRAAITAARPDLRGAEADLAEDSGDAPGDATAEGSGASASAPVASAPALPPSAVKNHAAARQALAAVEVYFQRNEPSSAALLLVRQARHLIGKPLVYALEMLLPDDCAKAIVTFGPQTGFALPAHRLKALSDESLPMPDDGADEDPGTAPTVSHAGEAASVIRGVEEFFRAREKSSPVPILLQRARSYLDKDFQAIIDELIAQPKK